VSALPRASQILLVGQKIRQIRKSRHLTQSGLAARIGVTQSDLSRMENGEYKVGLDTLFKILQVFELSMSRFFQDPTAEADADVSLKEAPAPAASAEQQLLADWTELTDDARSEVWEFIAFKKMQVQSHRPRWKDEETPDEPAPASEELP
jgi:transcriptional regulator with XRE-family HTH domain